MRHLTSYHKIKARGKYQNTYRCIWLFWSIEGGEPTIKNRLIFLSFSFLVLWTDSQSINKEGNCHSWRMSCWSSCCEHFFESLSRVGAYSQTGVRNLVRLFYYMDVRYIDDFIVYYNTLLFLICPFLFKHYNYLVSIFLMT